MTKKINREKLKTYIKLGLMQDHLRFPDTLVEQATDDFILKYEQNPKMVYCPDQLFDEVD
jgi:hypothetical protein